MPPKLLTRLLKLIFVFFLLHFASGFAAILYTSCILVGIFINSSVPIFFELFIETVYPVPEGITCGVVTFLQNLFMGLLLVFLSFYCSGESAAASGLYLFVFSSSNTSF